jgi:ATP-dependent helicase HrpA
MTAHLLPLMLSIRYPAELPVSARREEIVAALRAHPVIIVAGETGSGKTTQLPKMCLEAGLDRPGQKIGCTQPRRVAALSVSRRVAEELGVTWGREVGCKIRFGDDTGRDTRIKFMTDGILLAEIQSDPLLRAYSTLILDEAHERSLNIDFLLGYLQGLLRRRPHDLKVVITSATIDTEAFSQAFGGAPVVEVSGRMFPVEVRYQPPESFLNNDPAAAGKSTAAAGDFNHIDAAVRATEDALIESDSGDVLVFMPTERDIRDTRELLETTLGKGIEIIGLFGRMPAAEQTRIFSPGPKRRVIVATNIAETSLTIPRIGCVIDAGLSRMSRYNPRTRTKRLPVEPISQSSANQRAGRAGRVRDGICIRLYDQEDFEKRLRFTQPEIQRANLAEVILRMKAFRLGEIETFPFLNPPAPASIKAGYGLLHELGALDDAHELTPLGRELARLPLDPTLGRMLLQAQQEGALEEMLVIAAGLSIPDPREWPDDQKEAAAATHRAFTEPDSDFLTLLKIWRAMPEAPVSRNALRRFAKANYFSQTRLREWRDIHRQLVDTVSEDTAVRNAPPRPAASYDAIHRSILTGLLGQIAQRGERNLYQASGNRQVSIFPGSGLYQRRDRPKKGRTPAPAKAAADHSHQPPWIVAGEIVQTSQLFARTVARIDPQWVAELGAHLCKFSYSDPHWNVKASRVLAWERVLIYGLEVVKRRIDYGKIDPVLSTELFIRGALVAGEASIEHHFFAYNRKLRERIETALTRVRNRRVEDLDEALYRFYAARLEAVSSVHDLNRIVRARITKEPDFLCATEADLFGSDEDGHLAFDRASFPDQVSLGNTALPITYAYAPGEERDGVTVRVPLPIAEQLTAGQVQWMVPGLREEQIGVLLRALPKSVRRPLMPLEPKAREAAAEFQPGRADFLPALAEFLTRKYSVEVCASDWPPESLPAYLKPRVEVMDRDNKPLASSRDLEAIKSSLESHHDAHSDAWNVAVKRWERHALTAWSFGDLPESVVVEEVGGAPLLAYHGLEARDGETDLRLFRKRDEAERASRLGVRRLAERALARDLAWVRKELGHLLSKTATVAKKPAADFRSTLNALGSQLQQRGNASPGQPSPAAEVLSEAAYGHVVGAALKLEPVFPLTHARFQDLIDSARRELPLLARRTGEMIGKILEQRLKILASPKRYPGLEEDLQRLAPVDFPLRTPPDQLMHVPRYLRAVEVRAERAVLQPAKDAEKAMALAPFADWEKRVPEAQRETFRWMLEEFRVSIFAQELGTPKPVSAQRLKAFGQL